MPTATAASWQTPEANQSKAFLKTQKVSPAYNGVGHGVRTLATDGGMSLSLKTNCLSAKTWLTWSWAQPHCWTPDQKQRGILSSQQGQARVGHLTLAALFSKTPRSQCSISCPPAKLVPDSSRAMLVSSCCSTTSWQFRMLHQTAKTFCN